MDLLCNNNDKNFVFVSKFFQNPQPGSVQNCVRCVDGRPSPRSYTYSEGSERPPTHSRTNYNFSRSESVGEECVVSGDPKLPSEEKNVDDKNQNLEITSSSLEHQHHRQRENVDDDRHDVEKKSNVSSVKKSYISASNSSLNKNNHFGNVGDRNERKISTGSCDGNKSDPRHLRQYSDSIVESARSLAELCHNPGTVNNPSSITNVNNFQGNNDPEARDAVARLEPRGPLLSYHRTGVPYRSASFGQVDFNQGNSIHMVFKFFGVFFQKKFKSIAANY